MYAFLEKTGRPLLAAALTLGLGAGYASAAEYCGAPACGAPVCAAEPVCNPCGGSGLSRTALPGTYSNDYDYAVSSQRDTGRTYLLPTRYGWIESNRVPLTNPVDKYYATHQVGNGRVVETGNPNDRVWARQIADSSHLADSAAVGRSDGERAMTAAANPAMPGRDARVAYDARAMVMENTPSNLNDMPGRTIGNATAMETSARSSFGEAPAAAATNSRANTSSTVSSPNPYSPSSVTIQSVQKRGDGALALPSLDRAAGFGNTGLRNPERAERPLTEDDFPGFVFEEDLVTF